MAQIPAGGEKRASVNRILKENEVDLYTETEVEKLVDEIKTTGKDLS